MIKEKTAVTAYITKYALTKGIITCEGRIDKDDSESYFYGKPEGWWMAENFSKKDYFLTMEEALADAEVRRTKKIESLKKQIAKLEKLKING